MAKVIILLENQVNRDYWEKIKALFTEMLDKLISFEAEIEEKIEIVKNDSMSLKKRCVFCTCVGGNGGDGGNGGFGGIVGQENRLKPWRHRYNR